MKFKSAASVIALVLVSVSVHQGLSWTVAIQANRKDAAELLKKGWRKVI